MADLPEIDYRDWRGNPITIGCHIIYGVHWINSVYMVEAVVEKIHPRYTEVGKTKFPFHLYVKPLRRTDDETRYAPRAKWGRRIQNTERVTVIPPIEEPADQMVAEEFVNWQNELRGGDEGGNT